METKMEPDVEALVEEIAQLRAGLQNRDAIGQAKGIIRFLTQTNNQEAFELLSRLSQTCNIKVRDLAELIADCAGTGTGLPGPIAAAWGQVIPSTPSESQPLVP